MEGDKKDEVKAAGISDDDEEESEEEMPQEELDMNLLDASKTNNIEECEQWLEKKANPLFNKDGWNAVLWAACNGNDKLIRILHRRGAT